jgi:hypothetical protein
MRPTDPGRLGLCGRDAGGFSCAPPRFRLASALRPTDTVGRCVRPTDAVVQPAVPHRSSTFLRATPQIRIFNPIVSNISPSDQKKKKLLFHSVIRIYAIQCYSAPSPAATGRQQFSLPREDDKRWSALHTWRVGANIAPTEPPRDGRQQGQVSAGSCV